MKRTNTAKWIDEKQVWRIDVQKNKVRRSFYSSTPGRAGQREANRKADEWLEREEGTKERENITFLEASQKWEASLKQRTSKAHWRPAISRIENWAIPVIGHYLIKNVTEQSLQDVIDAAYKKGGLSAKTLKNLRGDLTNLMKFCRKSGYTTLRPEELEMPKQAKRSKKKVLRKEDMQRVFSCENTSHRGKEVPDRHIYAYRLMISEGLRPGELLALEWPCVRGGYMQIKRAYNDDKEITDGKNANAARTIKLSEYGAQAIEGQKALLRREGIISPLLFPDENGMHTDQEVFRNAWYRYCAHNGIEKITPYELRHTFVSVTKDMPEGLKKIIIGHSKNMDTEGIYSHEFEGDRELAAAYITQSFDKVLKGKEK